MSAKTVQQKQWSKNSAAKTNETLLPIDANDTLHGSVLAVLYVVSPVCWNAITLTHSVLLLMKNNCQLTGQTAK